MSSLNNDGATVEQANTTDRSALDIRCEDYRAIFGPRHGHAIDRALSALETISELSRVLEIAGLEEDMDDPQLVLSPRHQFALIRAVHMLSSIAVEDVHTSIEPARRQLWDARRTE